MRVAWVPRQEQGLPTAWAIVAASAARDDAPIAWVDKSRSIAGAKIIEVMPESDESGTGIPVERLVEIQHSIQQEVEASNNLAEASTLAPGPPGLRLQTLVTLLKTGDAAWSDNLYAQSEMSPKDVFSGEERKRQMQAAAMRSNLRSLLDQLAHVLPVP